MIGFPNAASETSQEFDQEIVKSAEDPLFSIPKQPEPDPKLTQGAVQGLPRSAQEPQQTSIGRRAAATLSVLGTGTAALLVAMLLADSGHRRCSKTLTFAPTTRSLRLNEQPETALGRLISSQCPDPHTFEEKSFPHCRKPQESQSGPQTSIST